MTTDGDRVAQDAANSAANRPDGDTNPRDLPPKNTEAVPGSLAEMKDMMATLLKKVYEQDKMNNSLNERLNTLTSEQQARNPFTESLGPGANPIRRFGRQLFGINPTSLDFSTPHDTTIDVSRTLVELPPPPQHGKETQAITRSTVTVEPLELIQGARTTNDRRVRFASNSSNERPDGLAENVTIKN